MEWGIEWEQEAFNRTILELKQSSFVDAAIVVDAFNRTILELKLTNRNSF